MLLYLENDAIPDKLLESGYFDFDAVGTRRELQALVISSTIGLDNRFYPATHIQYGNFSVWHHGTRIIGDRTG
jgi:hypothetical protein